MPSGNTHDKINDFFLVGAVSALLSTGLAFAYGMEGIWIGVALIAGYVFGTRFNGPDLDVKSKLYYRWGRFKFIWRPYQMMFSHRSKFTHGILLGDIIRYGYLTFILGVAYMLISAVLDYSGYMDKLNTLPHFALVSQAFLETLKEHQMTIQYFIGVFFVGNVASSTVHIIADHSVTNAKQLKNRFLKRK